MTDELKGFLKRRLSVALWPIVNLTVGLFLLPLALHRESIEIQTRIIGHLSGLRVQNGDSADRTSFEFTVNEAPSTFVAADMSIGAKFQFSQLAPGAELNFRVETARMDAHESKIPVLLMTYGKDEIVPPDSTAEFQFRKRMVLGFVSLILLLVGARQANRVRKLLAAERENPSEGSYDPILLLLARNPLEAAAVLAIILMTMWLIAVPFGYAHFGVVLIGGGYGTFFAWFRTHRDNIAWINEALSIEADKLAKNPGRTATFAPKHVKAVEKLLKAKVDINALRDAKGRSPLHIASEGGHTEAVDLLLRVGAQVDVVDNEGETPLMLAAKKGSMGVALKLLEKKPDLLLVNNEGHSASQIAEKAKKNKQLIEILAKGTQEAEVARKKAAAEKAAEEANAEVVAAADETDVVEPVSGDGGESN